MFFRQILYRDLGCASYFIACGGEAAVVDPGLPVVGGQRAQLRAVHRRVQEELGHPGPQRPQVLLEDLA